jgi:hypothetical protein
VDRASSIFLEALMAGASPHLQILALMAGQITAKTITAPSASMDYQKARSLFDPCLVRNPVRFPGFASII